MNFRKLLLTNIGTTNRVITDITNRYGPIITVGGVGLVDGVGGDFSHTALTIMGTIMGIRIGRNWRTPGDGWIYEIICAEVRPEILGSDRDVVHLVQDMERICRLSGLSIAASG